MGIEHYHDQQSDLPCRMQVDGKYEVSTVYEATSIIVNFGYRSDAYRPVKQLVAEG
jgi:hypothetical protein